MANIWDTHVKSFCQDIESNPPEYLNAFSSLALCFFGFMGLYISTNNDLTLKFFHSTIFFAGIGSFGYHWTLTVGWKNLNELSMLVSSVIIGELFLNEILHTYLIINKGRERGIYIVYRYISSTQVLICSTYLIITAIFLINNNSSNISRHLFLIFFGIPLIIVLLLSLVIRFKTHTRFLVLNNYPSIDECTQCEQTKHSFTVLFIGIGTFIFFTILDQIAENFCNEYKWIKYVPTHAMWYIGMSHGLYMISQFIVYMNGEKEKYIAKFRNYDNDIVTRSGCYINLLHTLFPIVDYYDGY